MPGACNGSNQVKSRVKAMIGGFLKITRLNNAF